jgi:hypothetical protein
VRKVVAGTVVVTLRVRFTVCITSEVPPGEDPCSVTVVVDPPLSDDPKIIAEEIIPATTTARKRAAICRETNSYAILFFLFFRYLSSYR